MTSAPEELLFSREHLWVRVEGGGARIGLTDFAQESLGDVAEVSLSDVGTRVITGQACGDIGSTKSVNDLVAPVTGVVTAGNEELEQSPELINTGLYGDGWLTDIGLDAAAETAVPLSTADYGSLIGH